MFHVHSALSAVEVSARHAVYREFLARHPELERIPVGENNDMVMLAKNPETEEATAVLFATGKKGQRVDFPRHRHGRGELTICLEGRYGEHLPVGEVPDDLFGGRFTLREFQARHPGVIEVRAAPGGGHEVLLGPGARWSMVSHSEHKPFGFLGDDGVLCAQIYWGGHNDITEPSFHPTSK